MLYVSLKMCTHTSKPRSLGSISDIEPKINDSFILCSMYKGEGDL